MKHRMKKRIWSAAAAVLWSLILTAFLCCPAAAIASIQTNASCELTIVDKYGSTPLA